MQHRAIVYVMCLMWLLTMLPSALAQDASVPYRDPAQPDAIVAETSDGLRLRGQPSTSGNTLAYLRALDPLTIMDRSLDGYWLQVQTQDGQIGWVAASYVQINADLSSSIRPTPPPVPLDAGLFVSGLMPSLHDIYWRGQQLGNRSLVFSKIGDSITVSPATLAPIGEQNYNLAQYQHLQPVIDAFSSVPARHGDNSFSNQSLAARIGWTTATVLLPEYASTAYCLRGESPLECELRTVQPSIAFIMLGTNDVGILSADVYQNNLIRIATLCIERGVIPVLSTLPTRHGYEQDVIEFNLIIRDISAAFGLPLVDYGGAVRGLPGGGLDIDGVHPNLPPMGVRGAADFRADNLGYGYVMRNLTLLYTLDMLWRDVIQRA